MDLPSLLQALSAPTAFPYPVDTVQVRQTHISAVFLAGPFVYKLKKPANLGFVDFSTLEQRRHFCDEEVRLNRRLAPDVYLGVVPVIKSSTGARFEGDGDVIDWAVKMRRLSDEATLHERLLRNEVTTELVESLARRIASFHRSADNSQRIAAFGRFDGVSRIILDIFDQASAQVGITVSDSVFRRLRALTEGALNRLRPLIEARAARGVPRDCHGDLHLDHVYYFPDKAPPADLVIIDSIEFNDRFRYIDPVADMAFPAMDLAFHGRRDLAQSFIDAYFSAANDDEGRVLLPLYTAYRATVRGMVEGLKLAEKEIPQAERAQALERARSHWLLALTELEEPSRKPRLVLVAGLPGTGKSRLAHALAEAAGFSLIRSDVIRKELAGLPADAPTPPQDPALLYSREATERTYTECLRRAEQGLFEGERVIVDATFRDEPKRQMFLKLAQKLGINSAILVCQVDADVARERLQRRVGDASDADWTIYQQISASWERLGDQSAPASRTISTDGSPDEVLARASEALCELGIEGN